MWLFAGYVLVSFALAQRQTYREQSIELARRSAAVLDGELRDMLVQVNSLARSAAFEEGDLARVYAEANQGSNDLPAWALSDSAVGKNLRCPLRNFLLRSMSHFPAFHR